MVTKLENTKFAAEVGSVRELNLYLKSGWTLMLTYVKQNTEKQTPRFVLGWQNDDEPKVPELLDEWELNEMDRQRYI
ncbi:MAG: hypothetical protein UZ17_ACD001001850 [Acidobacteria bacterium OLB17]|nr:MAG: hypothetical protein UZ17_ACD001001850 [Acidobacteria bacterium OLB17]MCZ2391976.1 hypothetical protein [Acidobacteriota bacterium]